MLHVSKEFHRKTEICRARHVAAIRLPAYRSRVRCSQRRQENGMGRVPSIPGGRSQRPTIDRHVSDSAVAVSAYNPAGHDRRDRGYHLGDQRELREVLSITTGQIHRRCRRVHWRQRGVIPFHMSGDDRRFSRARRRKLPTP